MKRVSQIASWFWALPWTTLGVAVGAMALATGGRLRRRGPTLEFHGGGIVPLLAKMPGGPCIMAMTLGHVILGVDEAALDAAREHELVHVRQYERWGPLFIPAYICCSAAIWYRGGNAYLDNPFECEAYRHAP